MFFDIYNALCRKKGLSANAVAKVLSISSGSVTEWKKGRTPQNATLKKIADYFDVTTDFLLGKEASKNPPPPPEDVQYAFFKGAGEITDEMNAELQTLIKQIAQKENPPSEESGLNELISLYSRLDETQRKILLAAARGIAQDK